MRSRSIRRAAERKAAKLLASTQYPKQGEGQTVSIEQEQPPKRHATGPRTSAGKAISCLNHTKHGLTGIFRVLESESQELFDELRDALRAEHAPATPTELILVDRLAEHAWLSQRAQRIADAALLDVEENWLSLMLRYRTTHDRAFHKCLAELRTHRREREQMRKQEQKQNQPQNQRPEFESQTPRQYTAEELDRLSLKEMSALTQAALRRVNINIDDFAEETSAKAIGAVVRG